MAAIRIQLPGAKEARVIALRGSRITIGRSSSSTVQILDRTMSQRHAELIEEDGHYRLHDLDSTNGVFVNGQQVTDYHLHEPCKLAFGKFECEFLTEIPANIDAPVEALPSQSEVRAVHEENASLKAELTKLRAELESVQKAAEAGKRASASMILREEHERVQTEHGILRAALEQREREVAQLQSDLAKLRSFRDELQHAVEIQKAELEAAPKRSELERVYAENAHLKRQCEAHASEVEQVRNTASITTTALTALRSEHRTIQEAHELLKTELLQQKAEANSLRTENLQLKSRVEAHSRELEELQRVHALLHAQTEACVSLETHEKLVSEYASARAAHQQQERKIAQLSSDLIALAAAREELQRLADSQRAQIAALPTSAEIQVLRAESTEFKERANVLAAEVESLRSRHTDQLASSIPREEYERVSAERLAADQAHQQVKEDLVQVRRQLAELQAQRDALERKSRAQASELELLRNGSVTEPPPSQSSSPNEAPVPPVFNGPSSSTVGTSSSGNQFEEALGKLGFIVRPVRRDALLPPASPGGDSVPTKGTSKPNTPDEKR